MEIKKLWEVAIFDRKFKFVDKEKQKNIIYYPNYKTSEIKKLKNENGNIKILTPFISDIYALEQELNKKNITDSEVIYIPDNGVSKINYYQGKFIKNNVTVFLSYNQNKLKTKYLYYFLKSKLKEIDKCYIGTGVRQVIYDKFIDIDIIIPPIEIQNHIIKILDLASFNYEKENNQIKQNIKNLDNQLKIIKDKIFDFKK